MRNEKISWINYVDEKLLSLNCHIWNSLKPIYFLIFWRNYNVDPSSLPYVHNWSLFLRKKVNDFY